MDKVALGELRELTGEGSQTFINSEDGEVTGNFYKVQFLSDTVLTSIGILGTERDILTSITIPTSTILYNVTSIDILTGVAVAYTNPALTGNIPA
tara:strand:+ start:183 stop:467 length:285 start_codon:yes stop_codon:yes gene_type:complete